MEDERSCEMRAKNGASIISLMMEAISTSETSVNFYETKRRSIPEGCQLHTCRRENLKSHMKHTDVQNLFYYAFPLCKESIMNYKTHGIGL
jgi:hypothetical protein